MLFVYYLHKSRTKANNFFVKFFVYMKMVNKYYQKHKEILQKGACERHQTFLKRKKIEGEKWSEIDIKILLKKNKKYYLAQKK